MRRSAALFLLVPAILSAQADPLDEGRLDPAWFGPSAAFRSSKQLGFQWLKPGLDLHTRSLRLRAWEPAVWLRGKPAIKDETFLQRLERVLPQELERGLRRGLKTSLPLSSTSGDLLLTARVVDAVGESDDYMAAGAVALSFDIKLVDGDSGELLGAFHDTLRAPNADAMAGLFGRWCEDLGRFLAPATSSPAARQELAKAAQPSVPAFDLEGALRRIEGLKRDGLLSEEECQALRKKAAEKAKGL